jgi:hypothetical protein
MSNVEWKKSVIEMIKSARFIGVLEGIYQYVDEKYSTTNDITEEDLREILLVLSEKKKELRGIA